MTANGQPQLIERRCAHLPNHSLGTRKRKKERKKERKKKERRKGKRSMIIIADCCREIIWLSTHLKCEDASLGQQRIGSLKSYTGNGPVSSL